MIEPRWAALLLLCAALGGCTTAGGYATVQHMARQSCLQRPLPEQRECESRLNREDYGRYEKERAAAR
jgi:hypothetical protein